MPKNNNTFEMVDIEHLTHEMLDMITKDWEKCVCHKKNNQSEDNEKEIMSDTLIKEPIILTILLDDSDWSNDDDETENDS